MTLTMFTILIAAFASSAITAVVTALLLNARRRRSNQADSLLRDREIKSLREKNELLTTFHEVASNLMASESQRRKDLEEALHKKNLALDALGYVWCSGGCDGGVHRNESREITEEHVVAAERNTTRMREWFENRKRKESDT